MLHSVCGSEVEKIKQHSKHFSQAENTPKSFKIYRQSLGCCGSVQGVFFSTNHSPSACIDRIFPLKCQHHYFCSVASLPANFADWQIVFADIFHILLTSWWPASALLMWTEDLLLFLLPIHPQVKTPTKMSPKMYSSSCYRLVAIQLKPLPICSPFLLLCLIEETSWLYLYCLQSLFWRWVK